MSIRKIISNVYSVGAIDWDRTIFDGLIPLPNGTSYNSFLIKGSTKTVLIDTVEPSQVHQLIQNLKEIQIDKIDYIIVNHAEQDHSGSIPEILKLYPDAILVTNQKCMSMLIDLLHISENKFKIVEDKEEISIGDQTLKFFFAPWVHWPETMFTYLIEDKILFSGDFLGSHIASSDLFVTNKCIAYESAKRYYAEIMMPFRTHIKKHIQLIGELKTNIICPTHGMLYNEPKFILDAYKDWTCDDVKNEVIIPYVSMHGSTKIMIDYLVDRLMDKGINVKPFNLINADIGKLAISLVDAATIVIGCSMVLAGPHPQVIYASSIVNALRPKTKVMTIVGSFGWGGKLVETLQVLLANMKCELIEPILVKGSPKEVDYQKLDQLVEMIFNKHKELNII